LTRENEFRVVILHLVRKYESTGQIAAALWQEEELE
jgi:hypothetical protein